MDGHDDMDLDNSHNPRENDPLHTPAGSHTPEPQNPGTPIIVTLGMWNHLIQRLGHLEPSLDTLSVRHEALKQRHNSLERAHHELAHSAPKSAHQEPKLPDPSMFSGERKELLPFLTKCQLKFEGQPSRIPNERGKILYAGSRLEGPAFVWFQPLIALWPADATTPPLQNSRP